MQGEIHTFDLVTLCKHQQNLMIASYLPIVSYILWNKQDQENPQKAGRIKPANRRANTTNTNARTAYSALQKTHYALYGFIKVYLIISVWTQHQSSSFQVPNFTLTVHVCLSDRKCQDPQKCPSQPRLMTLTSPRSKWWKWTRKTRPPFCDPAPMGRPGVKIGVSPGFTSRRPSTTFSSSSKQIIGKWPSTYPIHLSPRPKRPRNTLHLPASVIGKRPAPRAHLFPLYLSLMEIITVREVETASEIIEIVLQNLFNYLQEII